MANRPLTKMPVHDRAKQFMPFAGVKGLYEAIDEKERRFALLIRAELSDDEARILDEKLRALKKDDAVSVVCFHCGEYITARGTVLRIDQSSRYITIGQHTILFDDIRNIDILAQSADHL